MAGLRDLYESGKGAIAKGFDIAREKSADAFESIGNFGKRLRGSEVKPGAATPPTGNIDGAAEARASAAEAAYNEKVNAFNQRAAGLPGGATPPPSGPDLRAGSANASTFNKAAFGADTPYSNPNVGRGAPSAEAAAYGAQPKGAFPAQQSTGMLRGAARLAGPAAVAGIEGYNIAKTAADPETTGTDVARSVGRGALRGGMTLLGGAGGAAVGSLVPGPGTVLGGLTGGAAGYAIGDKLSDAVFGPQKTAAQAKGLTINPQIEGEFGAPPEAPNKDMIPTLRGGSVTPDAMMSGVDADGRPHTPAQGYGAFQRTTPGNVGPATKVGDGTVQVAAQPAKNLRGLDMVGGVASRMAQVKSDQARDAGKVTEANLGLKLQANQLAAARLGMELGEKNRNNIKNRVSAEAGRDKELLALKPEERKSAIDTRANDLTARLETSFARRGDGVSLETAHPEQISQALLGDKFRTAVEKGRGDKMQFFKDFIGDSRHDSDNVFSYLPVYHDGSRVYTANGNSMAGARAQGRGEGIVGWSPFTPNDAIDADMQRYLRKLPTKEEYEASLKKGK